ncbi:MAG TPA: ABC transporter permease subunit [Candidatus Limiplasma sp.]|nr:ABC transporter permease subunit [Candidatus Limiplasma sp.]
MRNRTAACIAVDPLKKKSFGSRLLASVYQYPLLYLMAIPIFAYYIIFCYWPMYGALIAFKDYKIVKGVWGSPWVGFKHFEAFFNSPNFFRLVRNSLSINLRELIFLFPVPIIFALLLNEVRSVHFRRITQTITYMPHFVSSIVICGLLKSFTSTNGIITTFFVSMGMERVNMLTKAEYFQPLLIGMYIWSSFGWSSIIYFAALSGLDQELYDAAWVDGAGRFRRIWHVTLPGIMPTVVIMLVLRIGSMMSVGFGDIINLYNPLTYETADVISTYVYRMGITKFQFSSSTAIDLFNSVINIILLVGANTLSRHFSETSLW